MKKDYTMLYVSLLGLFLLITYYSLVINNIIPISFFPYKGSKGKDDVNKIVEKFKKSRFIERSFNGELYPETELVKGDTGRYFIINLLDAITKDTLKFEPEKYIIKEWSKKHRRSMADFGSIILDSLKGKVDYKLYIKGSADISGNKTFSAVLDPSYNYKKVFFYKKFSGKNEFISKIDSSFVNKRFSNGDLPNLRASFIREKFMDMYPCLLYTSPSPRDA